MFEKFKKNSKDIGILTYDYSINYGAHLQAWALCEKCKDLGYIPHIIRWAPFYWNTQGIESDNMKPFREKYLPRTRLCYREKQLERQIKDYKTVIIGGDQVFRNWETLEELPILRYYGDFIYGEKNIISYAASFGIDYFDGDDYLKNEIRKLLKRFDKISVREKTGLDILNNTFNVNGVEVLDPVFLYESEKYIDLIKENKVVQDDYIAYMCLDSEVGMGEINQELLNNLKYEKIININKKGDNEYNPVELWIEYIQKSKFVITDSFHCVAFSIIFNKPFIVVKRDFGGNSRIENLLKKFNLEFCAKNYLEDITKDDLNISINWIEIENKLKKYRDFSIDFLKTSLELKPTKKDKYINPNLRKIRKKYEKKYIKNKNKLIRRKFKKFIPISIKNEYQNGKKRKVINLCGLKIKFKVKGGWCMGEPEIQKYKSVNYLISILKAYGIKNIISSPGCQNALFNLLVQDDDYFNCISVTDERSAGYVASGIAEETQEPVVITCTGSTASRNYIPALTEAFYKNIPIIAIPFYNRASNEYNLAAQFTDRKITQNDIKLVQVKLPEINDETDKKRVLTYLNAALFNAKYNKKPVIIEVPSILNINSIEQYNNIPLDSWHSECVENIDNSHMDELKNKNIAVFIGSHPKFTQKQQNTVSEFAKSWNAPVFCDHTSNYHGENKILSAKANISKVVKPDLIIDIGGVTGDYFANGLFSNAEIWRIEPLKKFNCRYDLAVRKIFAMEEDKFFTAFQNKNEPYNKYFSALKETIAAKSYPKFPLGNYYIVQALAKYLPKNCVLHHGVSNTKRGMNFFEFDESIDISCNVGVCGIDGAVSSLIGHSLVKPDKMHFGIMGDLTFFYDMNVLQNRDIKNNVRILLINNNGGVEFKIGGFYRPIADKTDKLIASCGHNTIADGWAQSCGFHYMSARTKDEFLSQIQDFCSRDYDKPVLFEVFTKDEDEKATLDMILESFGEK